MNFCILVRILGMWAFIRSACRPFYQIRSGKLRSIRAARSIGGRIGGPAEIAVNFYCKSALASLRLGVRFLSSCHTSSSID